MLELQAFKDLTTALETCMKKRWLWLLVAGLMLACQVIPAPPTLWPTPDNYVEQLATQDALSALSRTAAPSGVPTELPQAAPPTSAPGDLPRFPEASTQPFAPAVPLAWEPTSRGAGVALPISLDEIANQAVLAGLSISQRASLQNNGFAIVHSNEAQFIDVRQRVSLRYGQPYYLTSDAAFHAFYLTFDKLGAAVEREELFPRMRQVTQAVLDEVISYLPLTQGTDLEADTRLAAAYLGVALRLFDPQAPLPADLEGAVTAQVNQVLAGGGSAASVLLPGFQDDFRAYQPTGRYAADPQLQAYYRGMTWFGRAYFPLGDPNRGMRPSRVPLIITLALRRANLSQGLAVQEWALVDEVLGFLVGPSDDSGPRQYAALMERVYGGGVTIVGLKDEGNWQVFLALGQELPLPYINTTFVEKLGALPNERGWRFMGQRFTLDAYVLQNLVYDRVGSPENPRLLPSGLDVMAALGAPAAMPILERNQTARFSNYPKQMSRLQNAVQEQSQAQWISSANGIWLYTLLPQVAAKGQAYSPYMQTPQWAYKELNSALGGWVEMKHSAAQFAMKPAAAAGGSQPASGPAPGIVEPLPDVFYRLAYLSSVIAEGLEQRGLRGSESDDPFTLTALLDGMRTLATQLQELGDLADKELVGLPLDQEDYALVQAALGPVETLVQHNRIVAASGGTAPQEMPPMPVITSIAGAGDQTLQAGVGLVDRIYVVVSLEGKTQVAQGGVFSYYEFSQPLAEPLDDGRWQQVILASPEFPLPDWSASYILMQGFPMDVLAFRVGDVYRITTAGDRLNVRKTPSRAAGVLRQLQQGEYVKIIDGPLQAQGFIWWKIQFDLSLAAPLEGWVVENPDWFERAWGQ